MAKPAVDCGPDELWRGQLAAELTLLAQMQTQIRLIEGEARRLGGSGRSHEAVADDSGVGPRLSEAVVAWIDDPHRFRDSAGGGSLCGPGPQTPAVGHLRPFGSSDQAWP